MSLRKTIQINPELFKLPGAKTRRQRDKKELELTPKINPNTLKNKLLKRIKEHKKQEIKKQQENGNKGETFSPSDEFSGALQYFSDLSKKQKIEKQQQLINSKTLKAYTSPTSNQVNINVELPEELLQDNSNEILGSSVFNVNYQKNDEVPYGCLKNGHKKTYRQWKQMNQPIDLPDIVRPPTPPKKDFIIENNQSISREERLNAIKNKLRQLEEKDNISKQKPLEHITSLSNFENIKERWDKEEEFVMPIDPPKIETPGTDFDKLLAANKKEQEEKNNKMKKFIKKTVKKKFTLGKSDKLRRVSVLIKNQQTRKNIQHSQDQLRHTSINDVKKYLRQHGLAKAGTTCPPELLRKTFEDAVFSGEITNTNREMLLHNFLNDTSEKN
jgi:hypothetical protein